MGTLQERWRHLSRGTLHTSPTITDWGVILGFDTVLVRRSATGYELAADAERLLCLLSIARRRPQSPQALDVLRRALSKAEWLDQARRQIDGANGRAIEWYFHDQDAAILAHQAFATEGYNDLISIHILPFPGGRAQSQPKNTRIPKKYIGQAVIGRNFDVRSNQDVVRGSNNVR